VKIIRRFIGAESSPIRYGLLGAPVHILSAVTTRYSKDAILFAKAGPALPVR